MTREEEIKQASKVFGLRKSGAAMFQLGAEWADNNPKNGLVSVDWVCDYIGQKFTEKACYYLVADLINNLRMTVNKHFAEKAKI